MKKEPGHLLAPELDLSTKLYHCLVEQIGRKLIIKSQSTKSAADIKTWTQRIIFRWYLGEGVFEIYRLTENVEEEIKNYYSNFLKYIDKPVKVRLKSISHCRGLMPHSDASSGGDKASVTIGVVTSKEITHWYNAGLEFDINSATPWQILKLKKTGTVCLQDQQACLFNNEQVHSVSNGSNVSRFLLVLSWQDVNFQQLSTAYQKWKTDEIQSC